MRFWWRTILGTVLVVLLLSIKPGSVVGYYFFDQPAASSHPYLLINSNERSAVLDRVNRIAPVASAYAMMGIVKSYNSDTWPYNLADNSFYALVSDDANVRNAAIANFKDHVTGSNRYNFDNFNQIDNKYLYNYSCTSLALSYDWLYPYLDETVRSEAKDLLLEWGRGLYNYYRPQWYLSGQNFFAGTTGCLGLIGLSLENEASEARIWTDSVKTALVDYFYNGRFNYGGDSVDGPNYQYYGFSPPILFSAAYERKRGLDIISGTNIMNVWDFYTYLLQPNNNYARYGDNNSATVINAENFYLLQKHQKQGCRRCSGWLWTWEQIRGSSAAEQNNSSGQGEDWGEYDHLSMVLFYPENIVSQKPSSESGFTTLKDFISNPGFQGSAANPGGMANLRTGWGNDAVSLWLVNRWGWQVHQHYDPNSFRLYAYGDELISYLNNRDYSDPLRGKLSQQNTVWVDKNDCPVSDFKTGYSAVLGKFTDTINSALVDLISSDSKYASYPLCNQDFPSDFIGNANEANAKSMAQADRVMVLVKTMFSIPYVVVFDQFNKDNQPHQYTWQAFMPNNAESVSGNGTVNSPFYFRVNQVDLRSYFISPDQYTFQILPGDTARNDHAFQVNWSGISKLTNLALLFPGKVSDQSGNVTVKLVKDKDPLVVLVTKNNQENIFIINNQGGMTNYAGINTDGQMAIIGKRNSQSVSYMVYRGTRLEVEGKSIFNSANRSSVAGNLTLCPNSDKGNLNCDSAGLVNIYDLTLFLASWSPTGLAPTPKAGYSSADLNFDQRVDIYDLARLLTNWSGR